MSDADSDWYSDVDNFPPLRPLVKNCLKMKPDRTVESSHSGNGRSIAKIKMNLSKAIDKNKNKPSSRISTRGAQKKQADDLMLEFGSDLAKLNENFNILSKSVLELLENCAKTENHTTSIAHEITELRQKMISMDDRMTEINDRVIELEQRRITPASQEPSLAPSYAEMVGTAISSTNVVQTPPPAERLEKLEYISSEDERRRNLLKVKVTHPAISNSSTNLVEHVKQFFAQHLHMPRREIDDGMYVTKLPQPNTVLIKLSDHRFKVFLFQAKKQLRLSNDETCNDLFINKTFQKA